jgi:hypothetical protein
MRKFLSDILVKASLGVEQNAYVLGTVGIGTSSPAYKLDVIGNTRVYGSYLVVDQTAGYNTSLLLNQSGVIQWYMTNQASTGKLVFGNGNGDLVWIGTTGNVGIGTSSPSEKLSVNGTFSSNAIWTTSSAITLWGPYSTAYGGLTWDTGQATVYATSGNKLYLASNGASPDMTIDTNGNVGIGTSSPAKKLVVAGASSELQLYSDSDISTIDSRALGNTSNKWLSINPSGGNVGIGTDSPGNKLTVNGNTRIVTPTLGGLFAYDAPSGGSFIWALTRYTDTNANDLNVNALSGFGVRTGVSGLTTSGHQFYITSGGNVGIGTTSPTEVLDVRGIVRVSRSGVNDSGVLAFGNYANGSGYYDNGIFRGELNSITSSGNTLHIGSYEGLVFTTSAAALGSQAIRMYISGSTGNIGIGTTGPAYKLDVNGNTRSNQYIFPFVAFDPSAGARTTTDPMSIKMWQNYFNGTGLGSDYGTVLEYYSRDGHVDSQVYFDASGGSWYRTASYASSFGAWQKYMTSLDISGTTNYVSKFTGANSLGNSQIFDNGTSVGIGTASPTSYPGYVTLALDAVNGTFTEYRQGTTGLLRVGVDSSRPFFYGMTNAPMDFYTNTNLRMRITADGNVGIGTTSPVSPLDVNGVISSRGISIAQNSGTYNIIYNASNSISMYLGGNADPGNYYDNTYHYFRSAAGSTNYGAFTPTGLGVGTISPAGKLSWVDTYYNTFFKSGNPYYGTALIMSGDAGANQKSWRTWARFSGSSGVDMSWEVSTNSVPYGSDPTGLTYSEKMRLTSGGNVGIGVSNPTTALSIGASAYDSNPLTGLQYSQVSGGGRLDLMVQTWGTGSDYGLTTGLTVVTPGFDTKDVRVGIGTSSPNEKLHVAGNVHAYAAGGIDAGLFASSAAGSTTIAIRSNGVTHFNGGNVGIGTASPSGKLEVTGIGKFTGSGGRSVILEGGGAGRIDINGDGSAYAVGIRFNSQEGGTALSGIWNFGFGTDQQWLAIGGTSYNNAAIYVVASGNVGINTSNPSSKFEIVDTTNATSFTLTADGANEQFRIRRYSDSNKQLIIGYHSSNFATIQAVEQAVSYRNLSLQPYGGNVGIGTTSPTDKLDVSGNINIGNAGNRLYNGSAADSAGLFFNSNVTNISGYSGINFRSSTTNIQSQTIRMFIQNDGNVGVGTTSPSDHLYVGKSIGTSISISTNQVAGTNGSPLNLDLNFKGYVDNKMAMIRSWDESASTGNGYLTFWTNYYNGSSNVFTEKMRITPGGNVLVGTTTNLGSDINANSSIRIGVAFNNAASLILGDSGTAYWTVSRPANSGNFRISSYALNAVEIEPATGNVGIGTTSPGYKIDVAGAAGDWAARFSSNAGASAYFAHGGGYGGYINAGSNASSSTYILELISNGSTRVYVRGDGNVGIGTTSPSQKLQVDGALRLTSNPSVTADGTAAYFWNQAGVGPTIGGLKFQVQTNGATTAMTIDDSQRVGIGTASPGARLDVLSTGEVSVFRSSNTNLYVTYRANGTDVGYVGNGIGVVGGGSATDFGFQSINNTVFSTGGTGLERMRITSSGDLLIGATTSTYAFSNRGVIQINGASNAILGLTTGGVDSGYLYHTGTDMLVWNSKAGYVAIGTNNAERMRITSGGNVGIGTTTIFHSAKLSVAGLMHFPFDSNSDIGGAVQGFWTQGANGTNYYAGGLKFYYFNNPSGSGYSLQQGMTLDGQGNVGIGTTSPEQKLHVEGTIQLGNQENLAWAYDNGFYYNYITNFYDNSTGMAFRAGSWTGGNNVDFSFQTYYGGSWSTKLAIKGDGNVGIGTTSPSAKLQVDGSNSNGLIQAYVTSGGGNALRLNTNFGGGNYIDINPYISGVSNGGLEIAQNGTQRLVISAAGSVGIGTTSPSYKLQVHADGGGLYVIAANSAPYTQTIASFVYGGNSNSINIENQGGKASLQARAGGSAMNMHLNPVGGNVGIGTTAPSEILTLSRASTDNYIKVEAGGQAGNYSGLMLTEYGINWGWALRHNAATDNLHISYQDNTPTFYDTVTFLRNGNVGIGTTSPSVKLHLYDSTHNYEVIESNGANFQTALIIKNSGNEKLSLVWEDGTRGNYGVLKSATDIYFAPGFSNSVVMKSSGNVGIGSTSPSEKLQVVGNIGVGAGTYNGGVYANTSATSVDTNWGFDIARTSGVPDYSTRLKYYPNTGDSRKGGIYNSLSNTWVLYGDSNNTPNVIIPTGSVGIGTTGPSYKLHVEGNTSGISIYASHDIAAFSDITVKKDVQKIENAIEKVKELNGYTYVRTDDETNTRRAGVIAQEVQKVLPEVVSANPDGTLNVAYSNMIALLIEGMKEQQATIERLENRIKQLEK